MSKISAKVVAHSLNPQGDELVSLVVTFPRIILAELNTHRMLSRNSASSRAIPFKKMVKSVLTDPFIPIAFQKEHSGMQGTEYHSPDEAYLISEALDYIFPILTKGEDDEQYAAQLDVLFDRMRMIFPNYTKTLREWWLTFRDMAVMCATMMAGFKVSKQICNRLLEPFMWHTVMITGNVNDEAWKNFFELRCPQYQLGDSFYKSKKDWKKAYEKGLEIETSDDKTPLFWLHMNKGQAEIHMMALAESIYDTINESTPKQLQAGQWHIPFENEIAHPNYENIISRVKISTVMAARTSYTVVGVDQKPMTYERMVELCDEMAAAKPGHWSPFEHCARVMTEEEYVQTVRRVCIDNKVSYDQRGWCRNFKGYIQFRHLLENQQ
jgi:hypothetical protein